MNKTNFYQGSMSVQLFESSVAGVVRVTGEDSLPYLQSQLTIDLNKLDPGSTRLGLRLTLKGKVLLGLQVIRKDEEEFWLVSRTQSPSKIIELLDIQSRCTISSNCRLCHSIPLSIVLETHIFNILLRSATNEHSGAKKISSKTLWYS